MQRWTFAAFGALFAAAVVVVLLQARRPVPAPAPAESVSAPPSAAAPAPAPVVDAGGEEQKTPQPEADAGAFNRLPNGKPAPPLPATAPQSVGFGAILFAYRGAQSAPSNAPSKKEAFRRAQKLVALAKKDFAAAVKHGDRGSTADAGQIPRGVLEPAVEYILFTLPKGTVYDKPVDTPRGYWIIRRND